MKNFNGKVLFLDRSDINTDEIIPAKYLTELSKEALKPHCLEDLVMKGFDPATSLPGKSVIVTRANFGCGSSREHAPWGLEVNGINLVVASNFARIFRQNMFNCGLMAVSLDPADIDRLFTDFAGKDVSVTTNLDQKTLEFNAGSDTLTVNFDLGPFDEELVRTGGWVEYAEKKY